MRRYRRSSALTFLAQFSCVLENKKKFYIEESFNTKDFNRSRGIISQSALAFISSVFAVCANDNRNEILGHDDLLLLCNWHTNLEYPEPKNAFTDIFIRLSQEQLPFQDIGTYSFTRSYYLMQVLSKGLGYKASVDLEEVFEECVGLSINDYYWLGWCLFTRIFEAKPTFSKQYFLSHDIDSLELVLVDKKVSRFIDNVSADVELLRDRNEAINKDIPANLRKYHFNVLSRYPVFKFPDSFKRDNSDPYLITNSKLFLNWVIEGPYWSLRDHFLLTKESSQDFLNFFGEVFERYVGEILERVYSKTSLVFLNKCNVPEGSKLADWLVVDGNDVIIFECKSSLLPLKVKAVSKEQLVNNWCNDNILEGGAQLSSTRTLIEEGKLKLPGLDLNGKRIVNVLVTYQSLFFESLWLKHALMLKGPGTAIKDFVILSVADLELYESAKDKVSLVALFDELGASHGQNNFKTLCSDKLGGRLFSPFLDIISKRFWTALAPRNSAEI